MAKFRKFWKNANFRLKAGLIITLIFFIIGFVVYFFPHEDPFAFNTYPNKLGASMEHPLGTTNMGQDVMWWAFSWGCWPALPAEPWTVC